MGTGAAASSPEVGNHSFNQGHNTSSNISSPISVSAASSIYVAISVGSVRTVSSVIDNEGHTYTFAASAANGSIETEVWYVDNVTASPSFTVTAFFSGNADSTLEAAEITGAANPSLDGTATNTGHSLTPGATVTSTVNNALGFLSVVTANDGDQSFTAVPPDFVIDAIPVPAPLNIAGADLGEFVGAAGSYSMLANITGHANSAVDWAAVGVSIKPAP